MMTPREINKLVEGYIGTTPDGYLNHFSYLKHERFYPYYCDLDIDPVPYRNKGLSTLRAFIQILKDSKPKEQAKIIRGVFKMIPPPTESSTPENQKKIALYKELQAVAMRLETDGQVETPVIQNTSEVVLEALKDSEVLLKTRGPISAVDRAHTALHGYFKQLCMDRGVAFPSNPSLTSLFKLIRENFPEFSSTIPHDSEARRVFMSMATALDSLNTIRNRGSIAHPNDLIIEAPEAMLYINLSRAVLGYIESKTGRKTP